jgi:hypothetical protein
MRAWERRLRHARAPQGLAPAFPHLPGPAEAWGWRQPSPGGSTVRDLLSPPPPLNLAAAPARAQEKKKKYEPPAPPPRVGKKLKRRDNASALGSKLPSITPTAKCKLRLLKLERVKDWLLMEEEFVQNQERLKPQEERNEEDRSKVGGWTG